jgi:iron-sulfur cluster repair protein YtfE (RIC family)
MENKNLELMNIKDITDYIIETFHVPLRKDLLDVTFLLNKLEIKYDDEDQSILFLIEFFSKFKLELFKHVNLEEEIMFPEAVICEELLNSKLKLSQKRIDIIEDLVSDKMINDHTEFNLFLKAILDELKISHLNGKNNVEFEKIKVLFNKIYDDMQLHTEIENNYLYNK